MILLYLFSICVCDEIKYAHGCVWLKIFYHDSTGGVFFTSYTEGESTNQPQKFSILKTIDDRFKYNNKFEFLLEYPEVSGYNRWRQSLNPLYDNEVANQKATGYEPISISWTGEYWGGLVRTTLSSASFPCLIDGSAGNERWWYAIGLISPQFSPNIPGPSYATSSNSILLKKVKLWVRIDNTKIPYPSHPNPKSFRLLISILFFTLL